MSRPSMRIVPSWREPRTRSLRRLRAQRKVDLPLRAGPMMPRISFRIDVEVERAELADLAEVLAEAPDLDGGVVRHEYFLMNRFIRQ